MERLIDLFERRKKKRKKKIKNACCGILHRGMPFTSPVHALRAPFRRQSRPNTVKLFSFFFLSKTKKKKKQRKKPNKHPSRKLPVEKAGVSCLPCFSNRLARQIDL
jgi:hypothetical protein